MKILDIIHNPSTVDVTVELDKELWSSKVKSAISAELKKVKVDGFRAGKAPAEIANKYVNRWSIYQNVANKLMDKIIKEVEEDKQFKKDDSEIVGSPFVNFKDVNDESCTLVFKYELAPVVTLPDYKKIKIDGLKDIAVEEKEIDTEIEKMLKSDLQYKNSLAKKEGKEISEELPELTDELVASWKISNVNTVKELKDWLKEQIIESKKIDNREIAGKQISQYLIENTKVSHLPDSYVNEQISAQINALNQKLASAKLTKDQYLKMIGMEQEKFMDKITEDSKNAVIASLALEEIIEKEKIEVSEKEIQEYVEKLAKLYNMEVSKLEENLNENQKNIIKTSILNNNVIDKLTDLNKNN